MKYIIVKGASHEGKSTTIDAVCRMLNPDQVKRLNTSKKELQPFDMSEPMHNGCFVLWVRGKIILVSAGATTEHKTRITVLVSILIELEITIDFAIIAMRSREQTEGFDTPEELKLLGQDLGTIYIDKIDGDYENSQKWKDRAQGILDKLREAGLVMEMELEAGAG
jgi:hypothetical protein